MERPILFNTDMVKAILEGKKIVTRRLVKPRYRKGEYSYEMCFRKVDGVFTYFQYVDEDGASTRMMQQPAYEGDILYVRETWAPWSRTYGMMPEIHYKADGEDLPGVEWRPSIHMPKEAARIWLKVTGVTAERLLNMTVSDVEKEGAGSSGFLPEYKPGGKCRILFEGMKELWNSTISKEDIQKYGWDANPLVWVIRFERIERG